MDENSVVHRLLCQESVEYRTLLTPDQRLAFFEALPKTTRLRLKGMAVAEKGTGRHRLLLNDSKVTSDSSLRLETLGDLIRIGKKNFFNFEPRDLTTVETPVERAHQDWCAAVQDHGLIAVPGPPLELVGFRTDNYEPDQLSAFLLTDLYDHVLLACENVAKTYFERRYPLETSFSTGDDEKVIIQTIPECYSQAEKDVLSSDKLLQQYTELRRRFKVWLLQDLHLRTVSVIQSFLHQHPDFPRVLVLPQSGDVSDSESDEEDIPCVTVVLRDRSVRDESLSTFSLDITERESTIAFDELRNLVKMMEGWTLQSVMALSAQYCPLYPNGWSNKDKVIHSEA
ncbi:hypothetical protein GMRT_13092 [Giardia muris]|uniref:Uncharacterized protein n=1 Tax=Giardia muris TaxID=5742 RepID=A0A4Z1SY04_GIAMU|nr:hypothetical protein GMRT_13092 [Giardia muris]|eukprot:TNJ30390.1 hypothetical protein GMRT_13092 [Giardia muris]